jgi:DNA polymerase III subunit delta'
MNSALDKIPGQERVKQILNNFLQSKSIPHAFLFTGIDGVGKDNTAIQFAKALATNENSKESEKAVRLIEQLQEPYVKLIFPLPRGKNETDTSSPTEKLTQDEIELVREQIDIKSGNPFHKISIPKANLIKINSIRDIKKFLSMDYDEIGYRFVIISDAHLMNEESQNALLKSLEEPPDKVIFILTTPYVSKLRSTIISRCWRINFDPLSEDQIINILTEYFEIDKTSANEVAPFAMGSVQYALNLLDMNIHNLKEKTISILRYSFGRKFNSAFEELNSVISDQSSVSYPILVGMIITWLNDIQKNKLNIKKYFYKDHLETLEKFNSKFPDVDLSDITTRLDKLSNLPRNNINPSLLSASLILELSSLVMVKK